MSTILRDAVRSTLFAGLVLASVALARDLGPIDGRELPGTDLGRVAVGTKAPDFVLEDHEGRRVRLHAFRGKRDVVLVFYRGQW